MKFAKRIFLFFTVFIFLCGAAFSQQQGFSREQIREAFKNAKEDAKKVDQIIKAMELLNIETADIDAVVLSYYGALRGLQAKYGGSPISKLSHLKACLHWLDLAVEKDGQDLEVRFVRFSTIHHLPSLFGIPKRRGQDMAIVCDLLIKKDYELIDKEIQQEMIDFMLQSDRLDREQMKMLKNLYEGDKK